MGPAPGAPAQGAAELNHSFVYETGTIDPVSYMWLL